MIKKEKTTKHILKLIPELMLDRKALDIVVIDVRKTGWKFILIVSLIASNID